MDQASAAFGERRNLQDKPFRSLCYAPEVQLSFFTTGTVSACCLSRAHILGNVRNASLDEIWYGSRLRRFRETLRNHVFPEGCERCAWSLEAGNVTDHPILGFDKLQPEAEGRWPVKLEFALSNTCNLGCIHCSGEYSSLLRAQEGLPPILPAYGDRFFKELATYLPHAKALSFLGGEPFLQKECARIWDMLIDMDLATPCHVTTNGTIYDDRVERWLHNLPFEISLSLDGITKDTVESIRVHATYSTLMQNVRRFNAYVQGDSGRYPDLRRKYLQLNFCLMRQNWHEAADFFLFAEEELGARVWKTLVTHPKHCSLFTLPSDELARVLSRLEAETDEIAARLVLNGSTWKSMVDEVRGHLLRHTDASLDRIGESGVRSRASGSEEVRNHLLRAWMLRQEGRLAEALEEAQRTSVDDPVYFRSKVLVADIKTELEDYSGAEAALDEALELSQGKSPEVFLGRAQLLQSQGRIDEAYRELARARALVDKLGRVAPYIEEAIERRRSVLEPHRILFEVRRHWREGRFDEALKMAQTVHNRDPQSFQARGTIAMLRMYAGDLEGAEKELQALSRSGNEPGLRVLKAACHLLGGKPSEATKEADLALREASMLQPPSQVVLRSACLLQLLLHLTASRFEQVTESAESYLARASAEQIRDDVQAIALLGNRLSELPPLIDRQRNEVPTSKEVDSLLSRIASAIRTQSR